MSIAPGRPVYCLVTVLTPTRRIDLALPADLPVAELAPMLVEQVATPRSGVARIGPARPWLLSDAVGAPFPTELSLRELRVFDGAVLRLGPAGPAPPAPIFDDPVDAIAATAHPDEASGSSRGAAAGLSTAVAAALLLATHPAAAPIAGLGAVAGLLRTAQLARRGSEHADALAIAAVLLATATGWAALWHLTPSTRVFGCALAAAGAALAVQTGPRPDQGRSGAAGNWVSFTGR